MERTARPNKASPGRAELWPSSAPATAFALDLLVVAADANHRWPTAAVFVVLLAVTAACCIDVPASAVALVAALGWLFATGFLSHRYGDLVPLAGADVGRLGVTLVVAAAAALTRGRFRRRSSAARGPAT